LDVTGLDKKEFETYLQVCVTCLARAHARTSNADQAVRDHQESEKAIESGQVVAEAEI
jgi:hypothetical protein